jgi:1-acyl-sn-glycerol-3-phosphate acyltransferase
MASVEIPTRFGRFQPAAKRIIGPLVEWWYRLEVTGAEHLPPSGPVIVAANHRSMLDIPVLVVGCPRPIAFMGKQELFGDPFRRLFFLETGGFPVRRDIFDLKAIDFAMALLQRGDCVGLYPEGTRSKSGEMLPFLRGTAWIALRAGVPIVPCGLVGTGRPAPGAGKRKRVRVSFGPPIPVEHEPRPKARKERAEELTGHLMRSVMELLA